MMPVEIIAAFRAGAEAVKAVAEWACTPEGQATTRQWREDGAAFREAVDKAGKWIEGLFQR